MEYNKEIKTSNKGKKMFKDMPISSGIISIIILTTVFFLIDATASKPQAFEGNVIDK